MTEYRPDTYTATLHCPGCDKERRHRVTVERYNGRILRQYLCLWCRNFHPFTLPKGM